MIAVALLITCGAILYFFSYLPIKNYYITKKEV